MRPIGITAMGEILIDFVPFGVDERGDALLARKAGGAPLNLSAAAVKRGIKTAFVGKVGRDITGDFLYKTAERLQIDVSHLKRDDIRNTTLAFVELDENGDRHFSFTRQNGADRFLYPGDIDDILLKNSTVFHFGSLSLTDEPGRSTTLDAVMRAKEWGCIITYDPNYRAPLWQSEAEAVKNMRLPLEKVDIIKVSAEELTMLTGYKDIDEGILALHGKGITLVLVTDGGNGAYASIGNGIIKAGAPEVKCVDTTGAGDIFFGAFLSRMLLQNKTLSAITESEWKDYLQYAVNEASMSTLFHGGIEP